MTAPIPKGMKTIVRERITALMRTMEPPLDYEAIADGVQDLWPGATASQVRGVAANALSRRDPVGRRYAPSVAREPWKPGTPKPSDLSSSDNQKS